MSGQTLSGEFRRLVRLEDLGRKDLDLTLTATAIECVALARRFQITEISTLESKIKIRRLDTAGVFEATGTVEAEIIFIADDVDEAMDFTVNEVVEEIFATEAGWERLKEQSIDGDVDAEVIVEDFIDIGEVVAQNLSLALDPVLLEAGSLEVGAATYSADGGAEDSSPDHPFAALTALRRARNQTDDSSGH